MTDDQVRAQAIAASNGRAADWCAALNAYGIENAPEFRRRIQALAREIEAAARHSAFDPHTMAGMSS